MSTQEIGELIDSVNELTQTVASKVGEIDQRMDEAEKEFDDFTTVKFPERVQEAQSVKFFIDPVNGDDNNIGTSTSTSLKTLSTLREKTFQSGVIFSEVSIFFKTGYEYELSGEVYANKQINVLSWGATSSNPGTLVLKQAADPSGWPIQPFKAPSVYINETYNGARSTILKTFEFTADHSWPAADSQSDEWIAISGSMFRDIEKLKLDGVHVEMYDTPVTAQYMNGSMGNNSSVGFILAGNPAFYRKPAGAGAVKYANMPYLLSVYGPNSIPVDIVSGGHVLAENLTSFGQLFHNLEQTNVRSTHSLS
ncbi:hypothetical protein HJ059_03680 [Vibrio parahaemolyticus]|nr:hypothetical protein [Vibrio parahaemolyticus]